MSRIVVTDDAGVVMADLSVPLPGPEAADAALRAAGAALGSARADAAYAECTVARSGGSLTVAVTNACRALGVGAGDRVRVTVTRAEDPGRPAKGP